MYLDVMEFISKCMDTKCGERTETGKRNEMRIYIITKGNFQKVGSFTIVIIITRVTELDPNA